jgi:hypothetical protein
MGLDRYNRSLVQTEPSLDFMYISNRFKLDYNRIARYFDRRRVVTIENFFKDFVSNKVSFYSKNIQLKNHRGVKVTKARKPETERITRYPAILTVRVTVSESHTVN